MNPVINIATTIRIINSQGKSGLFVTEDEVARKAETIPDETPARSIRTCSERIICLIFFIRKPVASIRANSFLRWL